MARPLLVGVWSPCGLGRLLYFCFVVHGSFNSRIHWPAQRVHHKQQIILKCVAFKANIEFCCESWMPNTNWLRITGTRTHSDARLYWEQWSSRGSPPSLAAILINLIQQDSNRHQVLGAKKTSNTATNSGTLWQQEWTIQEEAPVWFAWNARTFTHCYCANWLVQNLAMRSKQTCEVILKAYVSYIYGNWCRHYVSLASHIALSHSAACSCRLWCRGERLSSRHGRSYSLILYIFISILSCITWVVGWQLCWLGGCPCVLECMQGQLICPIRVRANMPLSE